MQGIKRWFIGTKPGDKRNMNYSYKSWPWKTGYIRWFFNILKGWTIPIDKLHQINMSWKEIVLLSIKELGHNLIFVPIIILFKYYIGDNLPLILIIS